MNLKETAKALRESAEYLESIQTALILPDFSGTDIKAAFQRLVVAFPDKTIRIKPPEVTYSSHSQDFGCEKWEVSIHDGRGKYGISGFEGLTLADAVNAALADQKAPPADPVADVQAALTPAQF